jgi:hypothetical protein
MSLIIPANTLASGGYEVDNSLRFDDGSSDYLDRTPSSAGNRKTFTLSLWFKRASNFESTNNILWVGNDSDNRTLIQISDVDVIDLQNKSGGTVNAKLSSNAKRRDPSAWYHLVWSVDTTQATSSNRIKVYVNGVQETSFSTETYPSQNADFFINNNQSHSIGKQNDASAGFFDGYMAEVVLIDGQQLDPTSFGEFDEDSGIWKPIDVSGLTFGTNGFYLDFENSGSLGADVSGNGNNFTVNNLTAIDQTTDTPTNNFATLNPLGSAAVTFSEGNLQITNSSTSWLTGIGSIGASSGKFYGECKVIAQPSGTNDIFIGFLNLDLSNLQNQTNHVGEQPYSAGIFSNGGSIYYNSGTQFYSGDGSYTTNAIIQLAMDLDNGFLYWGVNGTWQNSSDPTSGATGTGGMAISNLTAGGSYTFGASVNASAVVSLNFGSPAYTISSGNTDGNGYGNFEYAPPSGYYALNTKNLSEFG